MKITGKEIIEKTLLGEFKEGQKLKYEGKEYKYQERNKDFYRININYSLMYDNYMNLGDFLEAKFELIEENKEIEELDKISYVEFAYSDDKHRFDLTMKEYDKINEIRKAVNKLIKESEEK